MNRLGVLSGHLDVRLTATSSSRHHHVIITSSSSSVDSAGPSRCRLRSDCSGEEGQEGGGDGTTILWDTFGVPHIVAPDHPRLFHAYGYAQMEAHAELLLSLYAQAQGRGAEFYGADGSASGSSPDSIDTLLEADRWVRTNGIPATARRWAAAQSGDFGPLIESFASGVSLWACKHANQLSSAGAAVFAGFGGAVSAEHVYAHCLRLIHYDWIISPARLARRLRAAQVDVHGSNEWAIGPSRSKTGNTMLLSNSHLQWGDRHTYFEVQLTAPGVNSSGAVWVGFPVLRQCFNDVLGWTQTTNNPCMSDLFGLEMAGEDAYVIDGTVKKLEKHVETIRVLHSDGTHTEELLEIRRSVHGPVVANHNGQPVAMKVSSIDRPGLFEQFWRMGLSQNLEEWEAAMAMQQLPIFNTCYADRDGHIMYVYNANVPVHPMGSYEFWQGVVPGDDSSLISDEIVPWDQVPKILDPPTGWLQNCNDRPWTASYPVTLDARDFAPGFAAPLGVRNALTGQDLTPRAQRSIRMLSEELPEKLTLADIKAGKLDTRCELADQFVDDLVVAARKHGSGSVAKVCADVLERWDRRADGQSVGTLLFLHWVTAAGATGEGIGGYATPLDDLRPLETPRGFNDPVRAVQTLEKIGDKMLSQYGTIAVAWGDALKFPTDVRRLSSDDGNSRLPGNGAPGSLGAIRTIGNSRFGEQDGVAEPVHGDTWFAVVEFTQGAQGAVAEALLGYGNWSKAGSKHVEDQMELMSRNELRPVWRLRSDIEANLESRTVL